MTSRAGVEQCDGCACAHTARGDKLAAGVPLAIAEEKYLTEEERVAANCCRSKKNVIALFAASCAHNAAETGAATFVKLPRSQNCRGAESCG